MGQTQQPNHMGKASPRKLTESDKRQLQSLCRDLNGDEPLYDAILRAMAVVLIPYRQAHPVLNTQEWQEKFLDEMEKTCDLIDIALDRKTCKYI